MSMTYQLTFGQACGKYRLKYIGVIKTESKDIKRIKLPTPMLLQSVEKWNSELAFFELKIENGKIEAEIYSHLTSVFYKSENLLNVYKKKRSSIPIILIINENGTEKEIIKEISWTDVIMTDKQDDKFGTLFELNLKEIVF